MAYHCNTCSLEFRDLDTMKYHYESDLHNDNVKRRVNGLVPLSAHAHGARSRIATSVQSTSYKCTICDKRFATPQTLSNHLQSQKHKEKKAKLKEARERQRALEEQQQAEAVEAKAAEVEAEVEAEEKKVDEEKKADEPTNETLEKHDTIETQDTQDTQETENSTSKAEQLLNLPEVWEKTAERVKKSEPLTSSDCLFSGIRCPSPEDALCYMIKKHSFTLPLPELITDVEGLLSYLALKVNAGICLKCGKMFETKEACQSHMQSAAHKMIIIHDGEYSEFYHPSVPTSDPSSEGAQKARGLRMKLANGKQVISKKEKVEHQAPPQPIRASEEVSKEKKMLTEGSRAHMTVAQMSRYQELLEVREKLGKKEKKMERQHQREVNKQWMRLGVHLNNQHGKGYQGDYVGKTI